MGDSLQAVLIPTRLLAFTPGYVVRTVSSLDSRFNGIMAACRLSLLRNLIPELLFTHESAPVVMCIGIMLMVGKSSETMLKFINKKTGRAVRCQAWLVSGLTMSTQNS